MNELIVVARLYVAACGVDFLPYPVEASYFTLYNSGSTMGEQLLQQAHQQLEKEKREAECLKAKRKFLEVLEKQK